MKKILETLIVIVSFILGYLIYDLYQVNKERERLETEIRQTEARIKQMERARDSIINNILKK